jgi:Cu-Zn family superoxide dismutase
VTTGTATTGVPAASGETTASSSPGAAASASEAANDPGATGQAASGGIDEQKTIGAVTSPDGASASASVSAPAAADAAPDASAPSAEAANANTAAAQPAAAADKADKEDHAAHADAWAQVKPAAAAPKEMQVTGTVKFAKADHGVKVMVDLKGLTPNGKHGFHIHEKGDLSDPKLVSAGPHFNPEGKKHGGAEGDERHGGDLGNITADDKGHAKVTIIAHGVTIDDEKTGIVGRSIIVHAKPDDEKTDPSGNSGDRIAGGAIEKAGKSDKAEAKSADAGNAADDAAQPAAATTTEPQELNK